MFLAEDTFANFREHGLIDNVDNVKNTNTNPKHRCIIWDLLESALSPAQAAAVRSYMKIRNYDITRNKSYPLSLLMAAFK